MACNVVKTGLPTLRRQSQCYCHGVFCTWTQLQAGLPCWHQLSQPCRCCYRLARALGQRQQVQEQLLRLMPQDCGWSVHPLWQPGLPGRPASTSPPQAAHVQNAVKTPADKRVNLLMPDQQNAVKIPLDKRVGLLMRMQHHDQCFYRHCAISGK